MKVKNESGVAQSCPTLSYLMDCSLPGSSVHGIFQARVLEWGAIVLSTRSSLLLLLSHVSRVQLCVTPIDGSPPGSRPWDSPGKNTEVGFHLFLQCMKMKSESEVAQSCPTLRDPVDCSLPGSSVHGIFQARVLEWGAIAFSHPQLTSSSEISLVGLQSQVLWGLIFLVQHSWVREPGDGFKPLTPRGEPL